MIVKEAQWITVCYKKLTKQNKEKLLIMKQLKKIVIVLALLGFHIISAMEQQEVLSASALSSRIFMASQLSSSARVLAELETVYHQANARLLSRKPAKKEGKLLWKVDLSTGGTEYTDDVAIWLSLLKTLNQVPVESPDPLHEKVLLLSVLASKSLALENAQRLIFAEDPAIMTQGWQQYFKLREPVADEVRAMVADEDRLKILNETAEQQTKRAIAWRNGFLKVLPDEGC